MNQAYFSTAQAAWLICCTLLAMAFPGGFAPAQDSIDLGSAELLKLEEATFQAAVEAAAPSVVQIETFGGLERVGEELVAEGPTTGTIVDADGWIISTLFSFRQQPTSILVTLPDGKRAAAQVVARDFSRELALLKVELDGAALPVARPAEALPPVGSWTVALGKTYDPAQVSQSLGIISALGRAYGKAVQTDAKVSPINYGGPLIDLQGRVLGVLAPISPGTFFEGDSSELYDSGIGFAIPLPDILERLPRMKKGEDIYPGKLGIVASSQNELAGPVRLTGAAPGSPAAKLGLKANDVIVEAGGKPVRILAELRHALAEVDAGETLSFSIRRGDQRMDLQCELVQEIPIYRKRYLGLRLRLAEEGGLVITRIEAQSPAENSELKVGQRIVRCNDQALESKADLMGQLAVAELDAPLTLTVVAEDSQEKQIRLLAETWPTNSPSDLPPLRSDWDAAEPVELIDVPLGDLPNKVFAVVPARAATHTHGLLLVFPEPGSLDGEKTKAFWEPFCRQQEWIVVVVNSANPRAWAMEEVELAGRVLGRLGNSYKIDEARTAVAGFGVGGRLGMAAAMVERKRFTGAVTLGTDLRKLSVRQRNAPLQTLDFLLVGDAEKLEIAAAALAEGGFAANVLAAPDLKPNAWDNVPAEPFQRWLEGLGRL